MLKITKSSQPIQITTLVGVLYSPPGLGKTTMAFTAEKPLLLDFDRGSHRAKNRRDVVLIEKWTDVTEMKAEDFAGYSTLVVDTAGRALDALALDIIRETPKYARGGSLSLQGYGELKTRFIAWIKYVRSFGIDVVLIAHSDESRNGDDVIERLDVQGGSKNEIYKSADFMGRISVAGGRRLFNLSPTETAFGKNPGQLPPLDVPDYNAAPDFLAMVIKRTKDSINALTEEQTKAAALLTEWADRLGKLTTAEEFNAQIEPAKGADEAVRDNVKRLLVKIGKERGLTFDAKVGTFSGAPAQKTEPAREPGADDGEKANRKAAEPTAAETAKLDDAAKSGATGDLPGVAEKPAKKGKAA